MGTLHERRKTAAKGIVGIAIIVALAWTESLGQPLFAMMAALMLSLLFIVFVLVAATDRQ